MPLTAEGFKPSKFVIIQRLIARLVIFIFKIDGSTRWGNEFIQSIDQTVNVKNPLNISKKLKLITGHGRLYWRSVEALKLEPETNNMLKTIRSDEVFYDIGSNVGIYSLLAAQYNQVRTISFEMELMNCSIQHQNIHINNLQNLITLIPLALSDKNSVREVFYKDISPGDALHSLDMPSPALDQKRQKNTILSTLISFSLDDLIKEFSLPNPNVLKIDVDGIELSILQGAKDCLESVRQILIEVDKHNEQGIIDFLASHGFKNFTRYQSHNVIASNYNVLFTKAA